MFIILALCFLAYIVYKWQRRKTQEKIVKIAMAFRSSGVDDSEPLQPSNVRPNLAPFRIAKLDELQKGKELGSGAFGKVYKVSYWNLKEYCDRNSMSVIFLISNENFLCVFHIYPNGMRFLDLHRVLCAIRGRCLRDIYPSPFSVFGCAINK